MNKIKAILFTLVCISLVNAEEFNPTFTYNASGGITDVVYKENKLYVSTSASSVDIFDTLKKEKINSIKLPKTRDFMGDIVDSKLYSVDVLKNKILILSQGKKGGRAVNIYENGKLTEVISDKKRLFIAKAKFIDEQTIVFALLSSEVFVYDLKKQKVLQIEQVSQSKFSNFVLTEDKKSLIIADESGILKMLDSRSLKLITTFENQNLDNVFQVDTKSGMILTAGQDRRSAIYNMDKTIQTYKSAPFLIYSAGLSPSGKLAGIAVNEQNDVLVFKTKTKEDLYILRQNPAILTNILFINEDEIFVTSDHEKINYYKIK